MKKIMKLENYPNKIAESAAMWVNNSNFKKIKLLVIKGIAQKV